jgi:hypothetical protein
MMSVGVVGGKSRCQLPAVLDTELTSGTQLGLRIASIRPDCARQTPNIER